jgi:hypothetical protein
MVELLFSDTFRPIYHVENPSRQSWSGVLETFAALLGDSDETLPIIPFQDWLQAVKQHNDDPEKNPSLKILPFLERDFLRHATGDLILGTAQSRKDSPTLVRSTALDRRHLEEYVQYWMQMEVL